MAGATGSDQELVVGRTNWADGRTILWAKVPPDTANFWGDAILIVEVAKNVDNPDDYEVPDSFVPSNRCHGIVAVGSSGHVPFGGTPGASGVIGRGGRNEGTGVVGLGGGITDPGSNGAGGIGVHGLGGSQVDLFPDPSIPPGAGVIGQGGRQTDNDNRARLPHAAGLIGIGGGTGRSKDLLPAHPLTATGGIGVYAQGAEATVTMVVPLDADGNSTSGPNVPSGPLAPGAGVLGRGGVPIPRDENPVAAGVIGLAGDTAIPPISETGNTGVYGGGPVGVFGHGFVSGVRGKSEEGLGVSGETDSGAGIYGSATDTRGRGGQFQSERSAQVWLVPQNQPTQFSTPVTATPTVIPTDEREGEGPKLPKDGRGGDLMTIADRQGQCTLWFCVGKGRAGTALWAQVLLGPSFNGQA